MKIAINPIGSIATKIGMKAIRNFSPNLIVHARRRACSNDCLYPAALLHNVRVSINHPMKRTLLIFALALSPALPLAAAKIKTVDSFREAAEKANEVLTIPAWEQTPMR